MNSQNKNENKNKTQIDESLYSRQMYVLGREAMEQMMNSNILISGLNGVGVELAKCVILAGVNSVTLHDDKKVSLEDLSSQYYLNTNDVGLYRTKSSCPAKLKELNPYVKVDVMDGDLCELVRSKKFDVVVMTDSTLDEQINTNKEVRKYQGKFICTTVYGGFGNIFCDFGDNFFVRDIDGEPLKEGVIVDVNKLENFVGLKIKTADAHNLSSGDRILVSGHDLSVLKVLDTLTVQTNYPPEFHELQTATRYTQVKQTTTLNFQSLEDSLKGNLKFLSLCSGADKTELLHSIHVGVNKLISSGEVLDFGVNDSNDGNDGNDGNEGNEDRSSNGAEKLFIKIAEINKDISPDQKDTIYKAYYTMRGQLCALHGFFGSIAAQEVMKACSGKFTPICQWLYYDILSSLPTRGKKLIKDRYYGQRLIFGNEFQDKLSNAKIFVVGAGAIGCEHLKNFAMMGIGKLVVTDMDVIEKSNLNRQFLFRTKDIGKLKSEAACEAAKVINPLVEFEAQQNRVGSETDNIYNETFFKGLTCVANALDNVQTRLYVDNLCVSYQKCLLESGTLGTKGNVQVILPHLTESYGSVQDPPETSVPVCTIKNFPYLIEHCVQYARDLFEGYFVQAPNNTQKYLCDPSTLSSLSSQLTPTDLITVVNDIIQVIDHKPNSFNDCINYSFNEWHNLFRNQIQQLRHNFPEDTKTNEGAFFWSGTKKFPVFLDFDITNPLHMDFINSFANIWANIFGIEVMPREYVENYVSNLIAPDFTPSNLVKISTTDEEEKKKQTEYVDEVDSKKKVLWEYINKFNPNGPDTDKSTKKLEKLKINTQQFEKDDDTNHHIDFITAVANLRATNYTIATVERLAIKGIAGKIIPAIATTTALVSSLVTLELYKYISGIQDIEKYNNTYVNLALPYIGFSEPVPTKSFTIKDNKFTFWDSLKFNDLPFGQIIDEVQKKYQIVVSNIFAGKIMLYSVDFLSPKEQELRLQQKPTDVYNKIAKADPISPLLLTVISDDDTEIPTFKIYF